MTRPATLLLLAVVSASVSCGGAAEDAKTPALASDASSSEDLATPDRAYAAVNRAEGELALALGLGPSTRDKEKNLAPEQPPPPPPAPPALAQPSAAPMAPTTPRPTVVAKDADQLRAEEREAPRKAAPAAGGPPCPTACAALASMERATDHLCTLAGADDARCADARARVKSATARVHAACPACGG